MFWEENIVKSKNALILDAEEPFLGCQGPRGLKGNGRSATLETESEIRPPGTQNIEALYFLINLQYMYEKNLANIF